MRNNKECKEQQLAEEVLQKLKSYFTPSVINEMSHVIKSGAIFIYIEGRVVNIKELLPVAVGRVFLSEDIASAENTLKKDEEHASLFNAVGNNMLQKIL